MSGNWDTYICQVDDAPASILVDLDLARTVPHEQYPFLGHISIPLQTPDKHGLPRQDEYERLGVLEDGLEIALTRSEQAVYAGRCASGGYFDFFYYLRTPENWERRVRDAMAGLPDYRWAAGTQNDPDWEVYICFLFPDKYAMNGIQNRRALRELEEQGDGLGKSRVIEHWATFPDEPSALAFSTGLEERGFSIRRDLLPEPESSPARPTAGHSGSNSHFLEADQAQTRVPPAPAGDLQTLAQRNVGDRPLGDQTVEPLPGGVSHPDPLFGARGQPAYRPEIRPTIRNNEAILVYFSRPDAPEDIDAVTFSLVELAASHGGVYQGWGSPVVV